MATEVTTCCSEPGGSYCRITTGIHMCFTDMTDALYPEAQAVTLPLNAMRCPVCGHRLDDMDGCDSCTADKDEAIRQAEEGPGCGD